jgi:uncharacterized protein YndB with AHSA1/START domain
MTTLPDIYMERKLMGSPAILWPLLSCAEGWSLWFAQTTTDINLKTPFTLDITYFPTEKQASWQGQLLQSKNQIFVEFSLALPDLQQKTVVQFFVKQNNDDLLINIKQTGFTAEGLLHKLKVSSEVKRLSTFWNKALHKLEYQMESRLTK